MKCSTKNIILIRHAKSSWEHNVTDIERPLNERGQRDSILLGEYLNDKQLLLENVFTSPARRALDTCVNVCVALSFDVTKIQIKKELYDFEGNLISNFLSTLPETTTNIVIFGHNYALSNLSSKWTGKSIDLKTCSFISMEFAAPWNTTIKKTIIKKYITPKELR